MGLHPVNSYKHVIDVSGTTDGANASVVPVVDVVDNPVTGSPTQVAIGSRVGHMFISVFLLGSTGAISGLADWYLWKIPGGEVAGADTPIPGNTGIFALKRFIFHEEKGLVTTEDGSPMIFKGVIKIPPRFRRAGQDDKFQIRIFTPTGVTAQFCVKVIYKEYR